MAHLRRLAASQNHLLLISLFATAIASLIAPANSYIAPYQRRIPLRFSRNSQSYPFSAMGASQSTDGPSPLMVEALSGKNALLTGASGGLGKALALRLSQCGVSTLILSARSEASLKAVAKECQEQSPNKSFYIHCLVCDLSDPESVTSLASQALQISSNQIDMLINNGGVSSRSSFLDTTPDVDRLVMQVNFLAGAALAKALVPSMVHRNHGQIVWISSVQGLLGIPNRSSYAASKFAVQGYCESIRAELAGSGVKVTIVSPGYIRTNLSNSAITGDGSQYGKTDETTALGADPDQVAMAVLTAAAKGQAELVVAAGLSAKVAIWLRFLWPSLLRQMLVKRYEKSTKVKAD
jgi:dehydrogenase/reductase SDR family protein 7B